MRVLALISAILALGSIQSGAPEPLKLKVGDTVLVTSPYGGEFRIMPDGAIYGRGFGRLALQGKTWEEAQTAMRKALHRFVHEEDVNLTLKDIRRDVVYLVGMNGGHGPVDLAPNLSLQKLLSEAQISENTDLVEVQVFRGGKKVCSYNVAKLLAGDAGTPDQALESDDVVTLTPTPFVRIWLTGLVQKPGQIRVPVGTDVYRAIAEAGGIKFPELENDASLQQDGRIVLRRGPDATELPLKPDLKGQPILLEPGDTISVLAPEQRRVTVAGEVQKPGEIVMRSEHSLLGAIATAGGIDTQGTLSNVLVLRKGDVYQVDALTHAGSKSVPNFSLEAGDLVYVQRNEREFVVLGQVNKPGKVPMKDDRVYRLSDALAEAGGLANRGSLRHIYLSHPDPTTHKITVDEFNLDEYVKDGKLASNPEITPGTCILFTEPRGLTLNSVAQFLSGALIFESLAGGFRK